MIRDFFYAFSFKIEYDLKPYIKWKLKKENLLFKFILNNLFI
jgi:hypothetical protein